jgi:hypothetical protein
MLRTWRCSANVVQQPAALLLWLTVEPWTRVQAAVEGEGTLHTGIHRLAVDLQKIRHSRQPSGTCQVRQHATA